MKFANTISGWYWKCLYKSAKKRADIYYPALKELERRNENLVKMLFRAEQKMYEMMVERDEAKKLLEALNVR